MPSFILRATVVLLIALRWACPSLAADKPPSTLAARLGGYQHVMVNMGPDNSAAILRLYTAKQQERNLKALAEAQKERAAFNEQMTALQAQITGAEGDEKARLREQYDQLRSNRGGGGGRAFSQGVYYTLLSVGEDYLELQTTDGKQMVSLLPLRLVSRVYLPEKDEEPAKPEPKS